MKHSTLIASVLVACAAWLLAADAPPVGVAPAQPRETTSSVSRPCDRPLLDRCFRRINIYPLGTDAAAAALLAMYKNSGVMDCDCDYWLFTTQVNGYCLHPTRIGVTCDGIEKTDPVAEMAGEIHRRHSGARMIAYMHPRTTVALKNHPQWRAMNMAGDKALDTAGTIACLNSGFLDGHLKPYLEEVVQKYDFDGFWFDGTALSPEECGCAACRRAFQTETGMAFPEALDRKDLKPNYRRWMLWRTAALAKNVNEITRYAKTLKPSCTVQLLLGAGREWLGGQQSSSSEIDFRCGSETCLEYFWHCDEPGDPLYSNFIAQMSRGLSGRLAEGWFPATCHGVDDVGVPPEELRARIWTLLSCGVVPQIPVGGWQRVEDMQQAYQDIKAQEEYLKGVTSLKHVGLVIPENSDAVLPNAGARSGQVPEIFGVYRMLVEEHMPLDVLGNINLERDDLSGYKTLIVPEHLVLSDQAAARLRAYVSNGGGLICSGRTGLFASDGTTLPNFALSDVLGAEYVSFTDDKTFLGGPWGLKIPASYFPEDAVLQRSATTATFGMGSGRAPDGVSFWGNVIATRATTAKEILTARFRGQGQTSQPFLLRNTFGKGRVSYVAARIGQTYDQYSYPYLRRILADEVEWASGCKPPVRIEAPLCVQTTFWTQALPDGKSRLVIHLLNETAGQGRARLGRAAWPIRQETVKIADIRIRLDGPFRKLTPVAKPEDATLKKTSEGAYVLPSLGLHQTITVDER